MILLILLILIFGSSLMLGLGFLYLYNYIPLNYALPYSEKKDINIYYLQRLIASHFKEEQKRKKNTTNEVAIAPSSFKVLGYAIGKPSAVLLKYNNKIFVIVEGETQNGIKLIKVTPNYVLIEYRNRKLKIPIKKKTSNSKIKYSKVYYSQEVKTISKALVERLTQNYGQLLQQIDFVPYVRFGKTQGFRIRWLDKNSIFYKLGFRQGDVILSVNGIPIRNTEDLFRVIQIVRNEPSLRVEILRNGQRETIEIRIE